MREVHQRFGAAVIGIGDNQFGGFDGFAANSQFAQGARDDRRGKAFAKAGNRVERARREFADQRSAFAETLRFAEIFFDAQARGVLRVSGFWISASRATACCSRKPWRSADARSRSPASEQVAASMSRLVTPLIAETTTTTGFIARGLCHDFGDARDAGGIAHRCAAKFHHLQE